MAAAATAPWRTQLHYSAAALARRQGPARSGRHSLAAAAGFAAAAFPPASASASAAVTCVTPAAAAATSRALAWLSAAAAVVARASVAAGVASGASASVPGAAPASSVFPSAVGAAAASILARASVAAAAAAATSVAAAAAAPFLRAPAATTGRGQRGSHGDAVSSPLSYPASRHPPRRLPRGAVRQQVFSRSLSSSNRGNSCCDRTERLASEYCDALSSSSKSCSQSSSNSSTSSSTSSSYCSSNRSRGSSSNSSSESSHGNGDICRRRMSDAGRPRSGSGSTTRRWRSSSLRSSRFGNDSSGSRSSNCSQTTTGSSSSRSCESGTDTDYFNSSSSSNGVTSSNEPPGDACSSSSSRSDILRWREDTLLLFLRGSPTSSGFSGAPVSSSTLYSGGAMPFIRLCSSSSSFPCSSLLDTSRASASIEKTGSIAHYSSCDTASFSLPQAGQLAVAASRRRFSFVPLLQSPHGDEQKHSSSSRDSGANKASAFSPPLLKHASASSAHDDSDSFSEERRSSAAWAKAAVALIAATAAAAAIGEDDYRRSHSAREPSPLVVVSCSASPSESPPQTPSLSSLSSSFPLRQPVSRGSRASVCLVSASAWRGPPGVRGVSRETPSPPSRCCGIVGYVGDQEALPVLLQGLEILQNRGYDSCGISSVAEGGGALVTTKFASRGSTCDSLNILREKAQTAHAGNRIGIGHTRWATHGSKSDANAHPHHDWKDRVSVVHNGTIDNFSSLKQALQRRGCPFRSETDSEVIANLIGWHLDNGTPFEEAVRNAVGEIQGTWGLCILHRDFPDRLVLARNGSPLLVGTGAGGQVFVASEAAALAQHTNQYMLLRDGEIAVITAEGVGQLEASRPVHSIRVEDKVEVSPHPFPHWTVKEIYEQPQALARAVNYGGRIAPYQSNVKLGGLDQSRDSLLAIKNLLICGCGTSLYAGLYGELLMQWLGCLHQVRAVDAAELELHAFPKEDAGILLLSQSGETLDTVRACQLAEIHGIKRFSVVNQVGSLLARLTDCGVYVNAGREVAVASTKAFSSQVTVLSLIAAWFFQNKSQHPVSQQHADRCAALMDAIQRLPVYAGMTLNCRDACASVAAKLMNAKTIFVLGKGFGYPVALEGALKIKEVGCIHAEGFAAGALKHGPFALIDEAERTPVIILLLSDQHAAYTLNAAQQVKARGAHLVCITDVPEAVKGLADDVVVVPSNGPLTALLACIPLQLLAYELAVSKGINPDKPRGLAKTVTVF